MAVVLVFIIGAVFILSAIWKPILSKKIKEGVYNASNHLYQIDFKEINLNLITGTARLDEVTLIPDTLVYKKLADSAKAPANIFEIKLKKLQFNRIQILKAYFNKKIAISSIVLDNPSINTTFYKVKKLKEEKDKNKSLYEMLSKTLQSIQVNRIKIQNADFDYIDKSRASVSKYAVRKLNITVDDFLLDSLSGEDSSRFFYTKDISFNLVGYHSKSKDKRYNISIDSIQGSTKLKNLRVKNFKLIPLYKPLEFTRKYAVQKDRYDLTFDHIEFKGINYLALSNDQTFYAKSLHIGPAKVLVFMSRESAAPAHLDKGNNYPHLALRRLNWNVTVDTVKLKQVDVQYAEYNPASKKTGFVDFKALTGNIVHLTNDSLELQKNHFASADLNTLLMGSGKLNVKIDFNLTAADAAFAYSGSLGRFDLRKLNSLSKPLGLVEIEQGMVQQINFKANGNLRQARGTMSMLYNGLEIKLLSDNIDGEGTKKKGFLSFLANKVLVKNDNPSKGEEARTATMYNERIQSASFFNLMWKTLFVGIKDIMGVNIVPNKNPVKQQKVIAEKIKNQKVKEQKSKNN